jgi:hypothetical protein
MAKLFAHSDHSWGQRYAAILGSPVGEGALNNTDTLVTREPFRIATRSAKAHQLTMCFLGKCRKKSKSKRKRRSKI